MMVDNDTQQHSSLEKPTSWYASNKECEWWLFLYTKMVDNVLEYAVLVHNHDLKFLNMELDRHEYFSAVA